MVEDELIDLAGLEVAQRILDLPGGPLPKTWAGMPLKVEVGSEFMLGETALPDSGWRQLAGPGEGLENDPKWGTVLAAPTGGGTGRWLLMHPARPTSAGWVFFRGRSRPVPVNQPAGVACASHGPAARST